jgi:hypothetical protein
LGFTNWAVTYIIFQHQHRTTTPPRAQWRTLNKIIGGAKLQNDMEISFETPKYMTQIS